MNKLVIQDDEGKTTVVPLIREEIYIGRKEGNTIRLTERNVSRRHARIVRNNGTVNIEDLDSYNGVLVNGSRIEGLCPLVVSDRVQIGDYIIEFETDEKSAASEISEDINAQATTQIAAISEATTIPHSTLEEVAQTSSISTSPSNQQQIQDCARLVALSANFAGKEFELNKPELVIGRTDDNDIVIDHQSISRHHAKILKDNNHYSIVDLQSSNGVHVNQEEYGKVQLRRGDLIDLGHVRMRFVEAGEDFVFGRDAKAVDLEPSGSGKGLVIGVIAFFAVIGTIAAFVLYSDQKQADLATVPSPPPIQHPVTAQTTQDASEIIPPPRQVDADPGQIDIDSQLASLLTQAEQAIQNEQWDTAVTSATQALALDAKHTQAKQIQTQANREKANELRYQMLQRAAAKKTYHLVAQNFAKIDEDSVYLEKARDYHDRSRDEFAKSAATQARKLAKKRKCAELQRLESQAKSIWAEVGKTIGRYESACKQRAASITQSPPKPKPNKSENQQNPTPTQTNSDASPSSPPQPSAGELIAEAKAAAKGSQFGKALRLCEQALKKNPGNQEAAMVCSIAACNLKSGAKAKRHIRKLNGSHRKGMARQICLRNGVTID